MARSVTPMVRIASAAGVPWATSTSTWRSLATISSGLCLFLDMDPSSLGSEAILQGGPLQRGRIRAIWPLVSGPKLTKSDLDPACSAKQGSSLLATAAGLEPATLSFEG